MNAHFDLVILIDCWPIDVLPEHSHNEANQFYNTIVNRLSEYDFKNVVLAAYDPTETSKIILDNIHSSNHGQDLKIKKCDNMVEVFREFPEACHSGKNSYNTPNTVNILICGHTWQSCTHWRPLGFIPWIQQNQSVATHPDLVWNPGDLEAFDQYVFEDDPFIEWQKAVPDTFPAYELGTGADDVESPCYWANSLKWANGIGSTTPEQYHHRRET